MRLLPKDTEHGWTPYVWLIYMGPYVAFPFVFPHVSVGGSRVLTLAVWAVGLAAFLILYFRGYWVDGAARLRLIVALALLGALLAPWNPGALMFFVYAAGFVGGAATPLRAGAWIGGLTVAGVATAFLTPLPPSLALPGVALMTPLIGFVNLHYSETRRRDAALKLGQDDVARLAALTERERIAGDLHDLLGHTLSVIVLKSELASKLLSIDAARAADEIRQVEQVSREALTEVRRAVHGFRDAALGDELVRARAVLLTAGLQAEVEPAAFRGDETRCRLSGTIEHAAAMIVREAITNVVRHARASRCRITVHRDAADLVVEVEDDGVGGRIVEGAGMESMRARAREVGGALEYRAERGFTVTLRVPLRATA